MSSMAFLIRSRSLIKTLNPNHHHFPKPISTFSFLSQEAQLSEPDPESPIPILSPLPPNPASGSPLYNENWRNPINNSSSSSSLTPIGGGFNQIQAASQESLDATAIMNHFAVWVTQQQWGHIKDHFEFWIRSLDKNGKPNRPDVGLFNHYLRANLMMGAFAGELLDLVSQMESYGIEPNTASYNLVLQAMKKTDETQAAEKLLERMIQAGKELPNGESFQLVVDMLLSTGDFDNALKYIDLILKSGYMLSMESFVECVKKCVNKGRLDTLVSIIERCKKMDQNKDLCPPWNLCDYIADVAMKEDNAELAFFALEFMVRWMARGENTQPPVLLSVSEGLVVSALGTASRTYSSKLLDGSWAILKRSLRQKKVPSPASYIAKISAHASIGDAHLPKAFSTLREFETAYKSSTEAAEQELFSPFTSLYPLVLACSKKGFETLDLVYYQLENLSIADPPYKSVAALNCIILGCANIWDVDRAYLTFSAFEKFGLTPNIHSYNALICAFGKLHKRDEAVKVFEHFLSLGVKPNAKTYSLLVDAHLIERDAKAALSVISDMVMAGFEPSREILKKVRRRCSREMDKESNDKVQVFAEDFKITMGRELRRELLYNLEFTTDYA